MMTNTNRTGSARLFVALIVCCTSSGCGTTFLRQVSNQFNSNTYVTWIPPGGFAVAQPNGSPTPFSAAASIFGDMSSAMQISAQGFTPYVIPSEVTEGDCFSVDYAGGYLHDSFEGAVEKTWSSLFGAVRSELSVVIKVEHRSPASTSSDKKTEATFVFNNSGQLKSRHISGQSYEQIFGPALFKQGDVQLTVAVSEQDADEYRDMVEESVRVSKKIDELAPEDSGSNEVIKQIASQTSIVDLSRLTIAPFGYVALGAKAIAQSAKILQTVHEDEDAIIREAVTLTAAQVENGKPHVNRPLLRYGTYLFTRSSTEMGGIYSQPCVAYSHGDRMAYARFARGSCSVDASTTARPTTDGWNSVTWVALNVRPLSKGQCV